MIKFRSKLSLGLAIIASFLIVNTSTAGDTRPFEQFYDPFPGSLSDLGWLHVSWDDSKIEGIDTSFFLGLNQDQTSEEFKISSFNFCTSVLEIPCKNSDSNLYNAVLQVCTSSTEFNCIQSLSARIGEGEWIEGIQSEKSGYGSLRFFAGDSSQGIPNGQGASLWHFKGISHSGGNDFYLRTELQKSTYGNGIPRLFAQITPTTKRAGRFFSGNIAAGIRKPNQNAIDFSDYCSWSEGCDDGNRCFAIFSKSECLDAWPHPRGVSYKLILRLNSKFSSFMQGRVENAVVSVEDKGDFQTFTIEAEPMSVPVLQGWVKDNALNPEIYEHLNNFYQKYGVVGKSFTEFSISNGQWTRANMERKPVFYDEFYFDEYNMWLKEFQNKTSGRKSIWQLRSLESSEMSKASECISRGKGFTGLVSSNAGAYIASPPTFNTATDSLDYKVASAHFDEKGNEFIGNYRFVIRQDVARCIYGFSSGPIKATVSVTSANGENQTSSTSTLEKDGWLYFNASGFTFSSPTIKVKLSQDAPAKVTNQSEAIASTPIQTAIVEKSKIVSKTITCIKGKTAKKVSGANPKCPTGYKLK